jgi:hypothetical protein
MWQGEARGTVHLSFTYTEEEYTRAARIYFARTYHTRFNMWLGACLALLGGAGVLLGAESLLATLCLMTGLALLALGYAGNYVTPRRQYRANPKLRERYELDFSDGGILFRSKGAETRLEWGFYSKVWETPEFYMLVYGKDMFSVIPKRAFRDGLQEEAFRGMLRRKLGPLTGPGELPASRGGGPEADYEPPATPPDWR